MEEKKNQIPVNKNNGTGCAIVLFIIILIIFIPMLIGSIGSLNKTKHETKLIEEGKTKTESEIINEIIEILKSKDEIQLKKYLSKEFIYYDNDNLEHRYISSFLDDLKILATSYDIERRGNDIKDKETYRIYWNVVEQNKSLGKTNQYYCLQKITILLNRVVKEDIITYEIEKIILSNN